MLEPAISLPWSTVVTHAKLALATPAVTNAAAMNIAGQHQLDEPVDWPGDRAGRVAGFRATHPARPRMAPFLPARRNCPRGSPLAPATGTGIFSDYRFYWGLERTGWLAQYQLLLRWIQP
jgi:hypothetical protein